MTQRTDRVAGEIREILGEIVVRQEIKDPRVRGAGIITFTHARVSGDLRQARAFFTVHGMDEESLERVRQGLTSAAGFIRKRIGERLRLKSTPTLTFEIDHVFEQEAHIDALLRELNPQKAEGGATAEAQESTEGGSEVVAGDKGENAD